MRQLLIDGFRNLDRPGGVIDACMEHNALFDHQGSKDQRILGLFFAGRSYSDEDLLSVAERLPKGQHAWAFSPTSRRIHHPRIKVTHVPATNSRQLRGKIAAHIQRAVKQQKPPSRLAPERLPFPERFCFFGHDDHFQPRLTGRYTARRMISEVPYEFYLDMKPQYSKLVVMGQDALDRRKCSLPHFFRWAWAHRIPASVMIFNDPSLYLDSTLDAAWWIGTRDRDYVREGLTLVQAVRDRLGISNQDILFVGMSAAGISTLGMASELEGSKAFVDIPRLTMLGNAETEATKKAVWSCLGYESATDVPVGLRYRIDLIERFQRTRNIPSFVLAQNMLDHGFKDVQYKSFRAAIEASPMFDAARHKFVEYSQWNMVKGGHFPLKESVVLRIISKLLADDFEFPQVLSRQEITLD